VRFANGAVRICKQAFWLHAMCFAVCWGRFYLLSFARSIPGVYIRSPRYSCVYRFTCHLFFFF